ncbi:hypothetical protein [Saccharopolyspora sp. CA-218241]|uniref:hypothetical protein n=1 Tax=Saccharopolyspora sp. CA-218241 TaxID=3240027 RepID=UPI003D97775A
MLISARGGSCAPGAPNHGPDYVVPTTETALGHEGQLGLDVTTVVPELTLALHSPSLAELLPKHEASLPDAHDRARQLAAMITA